MTRRVYLYAFDHMSNIVDCKYLENEAISVANMQRLASWIRHWYPIQLSIYAVDNRRGLYQEFREAVSSSDFTKKIEFADTIRHEGIKLE